MGCSIKLPLNYGFFRLGIPVLKQDSSVRICGDYNQLMLDTYPLPCIDDLFTLLSGEKYFSKLDLAQAYLQLPMDED